MNILFYLSRFPGWGGIETVTEYLGNAFINNGHQISILTHCRQDRYSTLIEKCTYYIMPEEGMWDTPANRQYAIEVAKNKDFDIIIYQDSYAPTERIALLLKQVSGAKLIVSEHNTPLYKKKTLELSYKASLLQEVYRRVYSWPKQLRVNRKRHLLLLKNSDKYIVLAKGFIEELIQVCGEKAAKPFLDKISFINNPICNGGDNVDINSKENIILFVGQLNYQKRVEIMLDIWKQISPLFTDWEFQIVGDGPLREQLVQKVSNEKIERVKFYGFQNPTPYYAKAKIFWMTSAFEGWPMTLLEAMQVGCIPIVMKTFGAVDDIIVNNSNGITTKAEDEDAFINATITLIKDEEQRSAMAQNAIKSTNRFSITKISNNWENIINNTIQNITL